MYDKEGGKTVCTFKLDGVSDAYEFSLVAVPAQRQAGVSKNYTGEPIYAPEEQEDCKAADNVRERELRLRARLAEQNLKNN